MNIEGETIYDVENAVTDSAYNDVNNSVSNTVYNDVKNAVSASMYDDARHSVCDAVRSSVWSFVYDKLYEYEY